MSEKTIGLYRVVSRALGSNEWEPIRGGPFIARSLTTAAQKGAERIRIAKRFLDAREFDVFEIRKVR